MDKQPETWHVSWHRMRRWMTGDLQCLRFYFIPLLRKVFQGDLLKLDFLIFLLSVPSFILKALGLLCLFAALFSGYWKVLIGVLVFDLFSVLYAVLTSKKRLGTRSIPALFCFTLQLPWIALSSVCWPTKRWVPGRQAPCEHLKKSNLH